MTRRYAAALHGLANADTWLQMIDFWQLSTDEAVASVRWAAQTLIAAIKAENASAKRKR